MFVAEGAKHVVVAPPQSRAVARGGRRARAHARGAVRARVLQSPRAPSAPRTPPETSRLSGRLHAAPLATVDPVQTG